MALASGITYFKLTNRYDSSNTTYGNDVTKNCSLTGGELDKNFNFLRGSDIESGIWNPENKKLVLKRVSGELIEIEGTDFSQVFSFSGSTFTPESGGTLCLTVNGSEPYLITGFTEACIELIKSLDIISHDDEISALTEDFMTFTSEFYDFVVNVYLTNDENIKNRLSELYQNIEDGLCDINNKIEREITNRKAADRNLNSRITEIEREYNETLEQFVSTYRNIINDINVRIDSIVQNSISDLDRRLREALATIGNTKNTVVQEISRAKEEFLADNNVIRNELSESNDRHDENEEALRRKIIENDNYAQSHINELYSINNEQNRRMNGIVSQICIDKEEAESNLECEKNERAQNDRNLLEKINERETHLNEVIAEEKSSRERSVGNLNTKINAETSARQSAVQDVKNILSTERNTRISEETSIKRTIDETSRNLERRVSDEKTERINEDYRLTSKFNSKLSVINQKIDLVKNYAKWLYIDDRSIPHENGEEVKWGVVIQNYVDGSGEEKRKIVLNLDPDDGFLSQNCNYLSSSITLRFNKENNHIELLGNNREVMSFVDANVFIQKGFLENVDVQPGLDGKPDLILTWNGGSVTTIDVEDLFSEYEEGNGISITNDVISIALGNGGGGEGFLTFRNGKLVTNGIKDTINNAISSETSSITIYISQTIQTLREEIEEEINDLSDFVATKLDKDAFDVFSAGTLSSITEISQLIVDLREAIGDFTESGIVRDLTTRIVNLETSAETVNNNILNLSGDVTTNREDINALIDYIEKDGEITEPSVTAILKVNNELAKPFEVGTILRVTETSYTFNNGSYQYGPNDTDVQVEEVTTGFPRTITSEFVVTDDTNYRFSVSIKHSSGITPYTNLGNPSKTQSGISAGTKIGYSSRITGYRCSFAKAFADEPQTSFTEEFIKTNTVGQVENSFEIPITTLNKEVIIAIPSNKTLIEVLDVNYNSTDLKNNFEMTTCMVGGVNGYSPIEYKVYYYIPDAPFTVNNTYKITIG